MKTTVKMIFVAAIATTLVSCAKEAGIDVPEKANSVKAILSAKAEDITKSQLSGTTLTWTAGDQIAVYQYGYYKTDTKRDASKNVFSYNAANKEFEGTIANYHLTEEGGAVERFYVTYPASKISSFGITTADCTINVPASQDGTFESNVIYFGSQRATTTKPITSYENETLTFLYPFEMYCATPVVKFNVPASLNVKSIVLSAMRADTLVNIAGTLKCRSDAAGIKIKPDIDSIKVQKAEGNISGDVYFVIAPSQVPDEAKHRTVVDSLFLNLTNEDGGTACLKLELACDTLFCGRIKNLNTLPENIKWKCAGIENLYVTSSGGSAAGSGGRLYITKNAVADKLYFSLSTESFAALGDPTTEYTKYQSNGGAASYLKLKSTKDKFEDCLENAILWPMTKSKWFGLYLKDNMKTNIVGTSCAQYGLTYTITVAGTTYAYPYVQSDGINFAIGGTSSKGYLTFSALQNGSGKVMIQSAGSGSSVTVTNTTKSTSVTKSLGSNQGVVVTDSFAVSAGDVIKVEFSSSVQVQSMSFVWEPTPTE